MNRVKKLFACAFCACAALFCAFGFAVGFGNTVNAEFAYTAGTGYDAYTIAEGVNVYDYAVEQTGKTEYNGIAITPFIAAGTFWDVNVVRENTIGEYTFNAAGLTVGSIVVLEFVNAVPVQNFETVTIAFGSNGGATFEAYNVNEISGGALGTAKTSITVPHWAGIRADLKLADYANENGTVSAIAFKQTTAPQKGETCELAFSGFILNEPFKYEEAFEYDASEEFIVKQTATEYNGLAVEPFDDFGTFWDDNFFQTTGIGRYTANAGTTDGKVAILEFVHPISVKEFSLLKIRACSNGGGNVAFFNAYEIENGKLGEKKLEWNIGNISLQDYSLDLTNFADENGEVGKIAIQVYDASDASGNPLTVTETVIDGFTLGNLYTVIFNDENGRTLSSERVVKGEKAARPQDPAIAKEEGYEITFGGWYNGKTKWNFDNDVVTEDVTLTAKIIINAIDYTCTFTDCEGNETEVTYTVETASGVLAGLKEKLHENDERYMYTNNLPETLPLENGKEYYEKKEAVIYTVTIGEDEVEAAYGDKITRPQDPATAKEEGYEITFIGWFNGETEWNFEEDTVTENVTLTAKFDRKIIEYTVTFVADGTTVATLKYTVENKEITAPEVPEKEGYKGEWESYELNCSDITVNAIYTEVKPEKPDPEPEPEPEPDPDKPKEDSSGCKSEMSGAGIVGIVCLACAAVIVIKKKRDN